ncbi:DNA polymerase eta [Megachile rotundata]|uniref:DNA polymerase eta n=1 Tax=Megachile rotundata TaxID=143995 RepID=UPI003FD20F74
MANASNNKIVVLIDMDCFFCQVETKRRPEYTGKPLAVVQYNQWKLGGIIAVNYEAREYGVTRHMRGEEAKQKCADLILASVPCTRGKADTSRYRSAGRDVLNVIKKHCNIIERASVDEAYLDITDIVAKRMSTSFLSQEYLVTQLSNTFIVGYSEIGKNDEEQRRKGVNAWLTNIFEELEDVQAQELALAGVIVEELRQDIYNETGFKCSAGISNNKILAKLACGLHKPNRQTILPPNAVSELYSTLPIKKVRNLGGKFGDVVIESLNCNVMGDLLQYSLQYLQKRFDDKTGLWLYNIARGIDNEPVTTRLISKSIGACKKFPGKQAITSVDVLRHWAGDMAAEVCERLEQDLQENERRATLLTVCYHYYQNKSTVTQSRSCNLNSYKPEKMADRCVEIICKSTQCPIAFLGISAGKFVPAKDNQNLKNFFKLSEMKHTQEVNTQTKDIKLKSVDTVVDTTEIVNNIQLNELVNNSKTDEMKNASNSKVKTINSIQLNQQISNEKSDCSPTSNKLNNLIQSLNERNKKNIFHVKKVHNCNFSNSLDQNDFKGSFFMNALNSKETKVEDAHTCDFELIDVNEDIDANFESGNSNENNAEKNDIEDVSGPSTEEHNESESSKNKVETDINIRTNDNVNNLQSTIKLEEIFPDLNNIDLSVLALLPSELQEEAKLYIKAKNKNDNKKVIVERNTKGKNRSKKNVSKVKKVNNIYSFLVKKESPNVVDIPSKLCTECCQMIPLVSYQEHCDFHVAENLQKELNNPALQTANIKRKGSASDISTNSIKRRPNEDISESHKSHTLTSFLS